MKEGTGRYTVAGEDGVYVFIFENDYESLHLYKQL